MEFRALLAGRLSLVRASSHVCGMLPYHIGEDGVHVIRWFEVSMGIYRQEDAQSGRSAMACNEFLRNSLL